MQKPRTDLSIILDLDETLVSMVENKDIVYHKTAINEGNREFKSRCFTITIRHTDIDKSPVLVYMIKRKGLDEFLLWARGFFTNIFIWSAGIASYVSAINDEVLGRIGVFPAAVFSKNDCVKEGSTRTKPLSKMIMTVGKGSKRDKLFILEDRNENVLLSDKANLILIPEFAPKWKSRKNIDDNALLDVRNYFEKMIASGVRTVSHLRLKEKEEKEKDNHSK